MNLFDRLFGINKANSSDINQRENIISESDCKNITENIEGGIEESLISKVERNEDNSIHSTIHDKTKDNSPNIKNITIPAIDPLDSTGEFLYDYDEYFIEAGRLLLEKNRASIGMIQNRFRIGFNRAARIMDQLYETGIVGPDNGTQPRELLMTLTEFEEFIATDYTTKKLVRQIIENRSNGKLVSLEDVITAKKLQQKENDSTFSNDSHNDLETIAADILNTKFNKISNYSSDNVETLVNQKNTLVLNCDYDNVLDFMEIFFSRCSPYDVQIVLIDIDGIFTLYNEFPQLLFPVITDNAKANVVINWLELSIKQRQNYFISEGVRDFLTFSNKADKEEHLKFPRIILIIREMQAIINDAHILNNLEFILRNGPRSGVFVLGFTAYDFQYVKLGQTKTFFRVVSGHQMLHIFDTVFKKEEVIGLIQVDEMSGVDFENFCASLLKKRGFTQIITTKVSGDYGGDIIATKDQIKYVIQCKRYSSSIGISAVQEVIAARSIYKCHVGVVLTNNYFTPAAIKLAESNNILLWNKNDLLTMIQS